MKNRQSTAISGTDATIGEVIRTLRMRRRMPHRNTPWSQEELAFSSKTHQSHISLIESNRMHPQYATLVRICDALQLFGAERAYLLSLADYSPNRPLPDANAVKSLLSKLSPVLEGYLYPVVLLDEGERNWYFNALGFSIWRDCYGGVDEKDFLTKICGKRSIQSLLDPVRFRIWKDFFEDFEGFLDRVLTLLLRVYQTRQEDRSLTRIVAQLKQDPRFLQRWDRLEHGQRELDLLFLEHGTYLLHHPKLGQLRFEAWRTHVSIDERFIVTHFIPADKATKNVCERLVCRQLNQSRH